MFTAIFESDCPFATFMRKNPNKSFVRIVDYVRHAAMNYNRHNAYDVFNPNEFRYIDFNHIHIYDERTDLNEVAHMVFVNGLGDKWIVTITEYDE